MNKENLLLSVSLLISRLISFYLNGLMVETPVITYLVNFLLLMSATKKT